MPLRSFYARAQSLSLTSYNLCDLGEFTRMFEATVGARVLSWNRVCFAYSGSLI